MSIHENRCGRCGRPISYWTLDGRVLVDIYDEHNEGHIQRDLKS